MATPIEQAIVQGIAQQDLTVTAISLERLAAFVTLLERWNRAYNLTAVRRPEDMVARHILDSFSIMPWLLGPRVVDVGSGAGLPGIPLAIVRHDLTFVLLDSNGKRTRFLVQAVAELGLTNVEVVRCRVEDYHPTILFDSVLARAFATLAALLIAAGRLCKPEGRILAMKGTRPDTELAGLPADYTVVGVRRLHVPGLDAERHLVQLAPINSQAQT